MPSVSKKADHVVDVSGEETFDILRSGQRVDTPVGPGVIVDITVQGGRYGDRLELEPPAVTVKLDDPEPGQPDQVVVCICKLGLDNQQHEAILRKEFGRLWPPITEEIPEDTHMLVDLNKKETEEVRSRFEKLSSSAHRVASVALRYRRQRRLYADYIKLALDTEPVIDSVSAIHPGVVVTGIEGSDLQDGAAVVLQDMKVEGPEGEDNRVFLVLYSPDKDLMKRLTIPEDAKFMGHDGEDATGYTPTVYDPMRLDSTELHPIRILPNSYLPKNPNYPSSITDTVWRPTVRQTPVRFYQTKEAGGFERAPDDNANRWPPTPHVNFPTPDTVNPPEDSKPQKRGQQAFDPADQPLDIPPMDDEKMEALAMEFWAAYQKKREEKLPGHGSTLDLDILDFADIFQARKEMKDEQMLHLFNYMVQIGMFQPSMVEIYVNHQDDKFTWKNIRTHY